MFHDMALFPTVTSSRPDGLNRSCTAWRHQARIWRSNSPLGASCELYSLNDNDCETFFFFHPNLLRCCHLSRRTQFDSCSESITAQSIPRDVFLFYENFLVEICCLLTRRIKTFKTAGVSTAYQQLNEIIFTIMRFLKGITDTWFKLWLSISSYFYRAWTMAWTTSSCWKPDGCDVLICLTKRFQWGAPLYGTHS